MKFEFATATRIIFGPGTFQQIPSLAADMGKRAFLVGGVNQVRLLPLQELLNRQRIESVLFRIPREPTVELILEGVQQAKAAACDMVIGMGGGSVLDAGKAISALLTNQGDIFDYLEVIGKGQPLTVASAPYIAIPTTAGTGAEVTRNSVLVSPQHRVKVSLRSNLMVPRVALVDPELTYALPRDITASTGLDALTQCLEPYVSAKSNPLTDALCREGLQRAARSLYQAYEHGLDGAAREDMALASLFGGLALANAGLGAVHGLAAVIGGMYPAPHGVVCAWLLPLVMETNVQALQQRMPQSPALARYDEIATILTGNPQAQAQEGIMWIRNLCAELAIPPLTNFGLSKDEIPMIVERAQRANSMKGNPIVLTEEELTAILCHR